MTIPQHEHSAGFLDVTFHPKWDYIEITRLYIENFLVINLSGSEYIHRVSVAVSELLENATKYSNDSCIRMILQKSSTGNEIVLSVFNKTEKWIALGLIDRIEAMNQSDPLEYYVFRMKESVRLKRECSKLGLARLYHECQARISARFDNEESVVEVCATMRV